MRSIVSGCRLLTVAPNSAAARATNTSSISPSRTLIIVEPRPRAHSPLSAVSWRRVVVMVAIEQWRGALMMSLSFLHQDYVAGSQLAEGHRREIGRGHSNQNRSRIFRKRSVAEN